MEKWKEQAFKKISKYANESKQPIIKREEILLKLAFEHAQKEVDKIREVNKDLHFEDIERFEMQKEIDKLLVERRKFIPMIEKSLNKYFSPYELSDDWNKIKDKFKVKTK